MHIPQLNLDCTNGVASVKKNIEKSGNILCSPPLSNESLGNRTAGPEVTRPAAKGKTRSLCRQDMPEEGSFVARASRDRVLEVGISGPALGIAAGEDRPADRVAPCMPGHVVHDFVYLVV